MFDTIARIGGLVDLTTVDTDGTAFAIFFQGCKKRCEGCQNPELQSFDEGSLIDVSFILKRIKSYMHWYTAVVFLGGEPLEQYEVLRLMLKEVKQLGLERWLYTGYTLTEIPVDILELCSVIVAGEYKQELQTGGFPASSNQIVLDRRGDFYGYTANI